jgi:hypothetical protein
MMFRSEHPRSRTAETAARVDVRARQRVEMPPHQERSDVDLHGLMTLTIAGRGIREGLGGGAARRSWHQMRSIHWRAHPERGSNCRRRSPRETLALSEICDLIYSISQPQYSDSILYGGTVLACLYAMLPAKSKFCFRMPSMRERFGPVQEIIQSRLSRAWLLPHAAGNVSPNGRSILLQPLDLDCRGAITTVINNRHFPGSYVTCC